MKTCQYPETDQSQEIVVDYGTTDGENIPYMPRGKKYSMGYGPNSKRGHLDVYEGYGPDGTKFFNGSVDIGNLLSRLQSADQEEVNSQVENLIRRSYLKWCGMIEKIPEDMIVLKH